jgi:hypothetical protein
MRRSLCRGWIGAQPAIAIEFAVLDRGGADLARRQRDGGALAVPTSAQPDLRINLLPGDESDVAGGLVGIWVLHLGGAWVTDDPAAP